MLEVYGLILLDLRYHHYDVLKSPQVKHWIHFPEAKQRLGELGLCPVWEVSHLDFMLLRPAASHRS
jgi:hypothetical protein